ncbi:MAG: TIGR02302 family protein [Pseudomonadota bacterium]
MADDTRSTETRPTDTAQGKASRLQGDLPDKPYTPDPDTRRRLASSRRALVAERLTGALWPGVSMLVAILGLALLGAYAAIPAMWHPVALIATVVALIFATGWGFRGFRWPSKVDARHRLDESLPSRPLSVLTDIQVAGARDGFARALWREHQRRAERAAAALRARAADLRLSDADPWGLRFFAPILLIAGMIGSGEAWRDRLLSLVVAPKAAASDTVAFIAEPAAEAWVVPPAYTGVDTMYLDRETAAYTVPVGSALTLRVTDVAARPAVAAEGIAGADAVQDLGAGLWEMQGEVAEDGTLTIKNGETVLAGWTLTVLPDAPPTIELSAPPRDTFAGGLEIDFRAADDYGVAAAYAEIVPPGGMPAPGTSLIEEPLSFNLPLPISGDPREVSDTALEDATRHPLAGGEVALTLIAEDGAGQQGLSEATVFRLPGRYFSNPLARALIEQRRNLALDFGQAEHVLMVVQAVSRRPEEVFEGKFGAYLATRTAVRRLAGAIVEDNVPDVAEEVVELLWEAAIGLDGGDLDSALERLRAAERALQDALENGTEEDIRRAMEEMRAAMEQYLREFARQQMERMQNGDMANQQMQGRQGDQITQQDLQELLDELQRRAESGLRDEARDMLSQLQRMLENLQAGQPQMGQQGSPGEQAMQQLQELMERQRDLSDRTFDEARRNQRQQQGQQQGQQPGQQPGQQGQQGQQPGQGGQQGQQGQGGGQQGQQGQGGDLAAEQRALQQMLDELRSRLPGGDGAMGDAFDEAGRAMGRAEDDLQGDAPGEAVDDQLDALDRLQEGAEALAQQLQQQGQGEQQAQGAGRGRGNGDDRQQADPFDRPAGRYGAMDGDGTDVPDKALLDRARELLDELRRRAGDATRPDYELDYLERLIERY